MEQKLLKFLFLLQWNITPIRSRRSWGGKSCIPITPAKSHWRLNLAIRTSSSYLEGFTISTLTHNNLRLPHISHWVGHICAERTRGPAASPVWETVRECGGNNSGFLAHPGVCPWRRTGCLGVFVEHLVLMREEREVIPRSDPPLLPSFSEGKPATVRPLSSLVWQTLRLFLRSWMWAPTCCQAISVWYN